MKKRDDIKELTERLQGFDGDELQHEMTDGLDEWCQKRQRQARSVKRVMLIALLLLTTTAIALTAIPWFRSTLQSDVSHETLSAPASPSHKPPTAMPVELDNAAVAPAPKAPQPVDYYYTGIAEDGYSVAYGHETRTLTYTRYSGTHLIRSVVHNAPEGLFIDTTQTDNAAVPLSSEADSMVQVAVKSMIRCDFQMVEFSGDVLYFTVLDTVRHLVSVRGDVAQWMGQPIRYSETVTIPATVEQGGITYTVVALADSAFAHHAEIKNVVLPATIMSIGDAALAHCSGLERLTVLATVPPEASPTAFDRTDALLTVPCGSMALYEDILEWLYFRRMQEGCR